MTFDAKRRTLFKPILKRNTARYSAGIPLYDSVKTPFLKKPPSVSGTITSFIRVGIIMFK